MLINKLSTSWLQWDLALPGKEGRTWIPFSLSPLSFFSCSFPASLPLFLSSFLSSANVYYSSHIRPCVHLWGYTSKGEKWMSWANIVLVCPVRCFNRDGSGTLEGGRGGQRSAQVAQWRGSVWILEGEEWAVPWDGNRGAHLSNERKVIGTHTEQQ